MAIYKPTAWAGEFLKGAQPDELLTNATYVKGKLSRAAILAKRLISGKPIDRSNRKMIYSTTTNEGGSNFKTIGKLSGIDDRLFNIYHNVDGSGRMNDYAGDGQREKDSALYIDSKHFGRYTIDGTEITPAMSKSAYDILQSQSVYKFGSGFQSRMRDGYEDINHNNDKIIFSFLGDGKTTMVENLELMFVPRETQFTPGVNLVAIASPGRNSPFYHYTGAEDTLEFTIDWLAEHNNREDVITRCRILEAYSKNDGYNKAPRMLAIIWGRDDKLYRGSTWVIAKAPYKLQNFNRAYKEPNNGQVITTGLLPNQAYQEITLKKVADHNLTRQEIVNNPAYKTYLTS